MFATVVFVYEASVVNEAVVSLSFSGSSPSVVAFFSSTVVSEAPSSCSSVFFSSSVASLVAAGAASLVSSDSGSLPVAAGSSVFVSLSGVSASAMAES